MNLEKPNSPPPIPENNPYAPPSEESMGYDEMLDDEHFGLLDEPRQCEAGRGVSWFTESFNIFKESWLLWIGTGFVFFAIMLILAGIGIITGSNFLLISLVVFHFFGGFMVMCADQEEGYEPTFATMFSAFQTHLGDFFILALLSIVLNIIIWIPILISFTFFLGGAMALSSSDVSAVMFVGLILGFFIILAFLVFITMLVYFAPPLIVLHDIRPFDAMKMSFKGCLRNMLPFLFFGLIALVFSFILCSLTIGLGIFIVIPIMLISYYVIYRDIWSGRMAGE